MSADRDLLAEALPRYEIRHEIGRGGWGIVYEGWHRELGRPVAIKQLARAFGTDLTARDRFIAEARLVAKLEHPHIVPVYDFVERDGLYAIVMELASGGSLRQRFTDEGVTIDEALAAVLATATGLHHAHSHNLLHRDVKPDNVLYSSAGTVKIADFGIAKVMGEGASGHTATGSVIGTPAFMAPEQVTGGELSPATDVYALAVVLFELLSGQLPFESAGDGMALLYKHVNEQPRWLSSVAPQVPAPLAHVVARALAKDPGQRPDSAEAFAVELATAATTAFGPGWLARTGLVVMGSTAVIGATERDVTNPAHTVPTVVVRPEQVRQLRIGELQSRAGDRDQPLHRSASGEPVASHDPVAPVISGPSEAGPDEQRKHRGLLWLAVGGLVLALIVAGAAAGLSALGDEQADSSAPSGPGSSVVDEPAVSADEITTIERQTLHDACLSYGVSEERCGCAVDRAATRLATVEFRRGLRTINDREGRLTDALAAIFTECEADGF